MFCEANGYESSLWRDKQVWEDGHLWKEKQAGEDGSLWKEKQA